MEGSLRTIGISKRFGATVALDGVDFTAEPGEIHTVLGENGAGKTTLMNIIAGRLRPDRGYLSLDGRPLRAGSAPAAIAAGIALVHQSPLLFERFTPDENLLAGALLRARRNARDTARRAAKIGDMLGFEPFHAGHRTIEGFSMAARVRLEILRALILEPRVLILDEPTALLGPGELAEFLELLRKLRDAGRIVILITHKLAEALAVADRVTVLRGGRVVASTRAAETSRSELAAAMVGEIEPASGILAPTAAAAEVLRIEELALELRGRQPIRGVSLTLREGEICAIAGVDGNGQLELVELLAGIHQPVAGRILLDGVLMSKGASARLAVIPQNRDQDGLILDMELWENLLLSRPLRQRFSRLGLLRRRRAIALCEELIGRFQIRTPGPRLTATALSGGHRQRLAVARALAGKPKVLVAHDISRGLDIAAAAALHRLLREFAAQGGAVLLVSSDLEEISALCHRLFVISAGTLIEVAPDERAPERIGLLMAGVRS